MRRQGRSSSFLSGVLLCCAILTWLPVWSPAAAAPARMLLEESGAQAPPALLPEEGGKTVAGAAPVVDAAAAATGRGPITASPINRKRVGKAKCSKGLYNCAGVCVKASVPRMCGSSCLVGPRRCFDATCTVCPTQALGTAICAPAAAGNNDTARSGPVCGLKCGRGWRLLRGSCRRVLRRSRKFRKGGKQNKMGVAATPTPTPAPPPTPTPTPAPPPLPPADNNTTTNASDKGLPPALPPTPVIITDESFCNPDKDYDVANNADDWDAMKACCDDAAEQWIADSDCNSRPPRPLPLPPQPQPNDPDQFDQFDYCNPSDYMFEQPEEREWWNACCDDARKAKFKDPDCEVDQFGP